MTRTGIRDQNRPDLIQETFIKLFKGAKDIREPAAVKAWLARCARNVTLDHLRKKSAIPMPDEELIPLQDQEQDELQEIEQRKRECIVLQNLILKICKIENDDSLKLYYVDGLSMREIAEEKEAPISTITTKISRLRKKFKDVFKEHLEEVRNS